SGPGVSRGGTVMNQQMPFGKYAGQPLEKIPTSYLRWSLANLDSLSPGLRVQIRIEVQRRGVRFLPAADVFADIEESVARQVEAAQIDHEPAAIISDVFLEAIEEVRGRHQIGAETELVMKGDAER